MARRMLIHENTGVSMFCKWVFALVKVVGTP